MRRRTHKLLLILLTLALAVAPLRGAWAVADISPAATSSSASHCEQMQHGTSTDTATHGLHSGHDMAAMDSMPCNHDCDGSCCDQACSACIHVTTAIPTIITLLTETTAGAPATTASQLFPRRPAIPLLQPPASSHS